jgi:hypothetical protein
MTVREGMSMGVGATRRAWQSIFHQISAHLEQRFPLS